MSARAWACVLVFGCGEGGDRTPASTALDSEAHDCLNLAVADATVADATTVDIPIAEADHALVSEPLPPYSDEALPSVEAFCRDVVGQPRVEEVTPGVFVALGYDLANTILLRTPEGNVIVDVGMSPARAREVKAALDLVAPGPVLAIIYTHGHIDHVGGAKVFAEEGTQIWSSELLLDHLIEQYGTYRKVELSRGARQFGHLAATEALPCSAIGRRVDLDAAQETGVRWPTHTFRGEQVLEVGGLELRLMEAPGETRDHLLVSVPSLGLLLPGDNYYAAFPNLYTIRGSSPRPVDEWIRSLDLMRRLDATLLVPSHSGPVSGREAVREALTTYRDAVQSVRDQVARAANAGLDVDTIAAMVKLPDDLRAVPALAETYGQVDWSARGLYDGALGWFDGRTERLYPASDATRRELDLMGGAGAVLGHARESLVAGDPRFALHLLGKLRDATAPGVEVDAEVTTLTAEAERRLAATVQNTNGRGWLLTHAALLEGQALDLPPLVLDDTFVDELPVEVVFQQMPIRLKSEAALTSPMHVEVVLTDLALSYHLVIRRGLLEVVRGPALPGTGPTDATVTTDSRTWKALTLGVLPPDQAFTSGRLQVSDLGIVLRFLGLFERGT
ncbi:MAG: MBL fold metallo-hydrolase [Myxococcales bacterium]|nr:MBL fold metallo-hydrolase [Myxococcales bacterium]